MTVDNFLEFFLFPGLLNAVTCGIAGTILLLVWAFGKRTENLNKRNCAKAYLIFMLVNKVLYLICVVIITYATDYFKFNLTNVYSYF